MQVQNYIQSSFVDFLPEIVNNESILEEGTYLENELVSLEQNMGSEMRNIYEANDEISRLIEDLEEGNLSLNLSLKLMKIDNLLQKINQLNETENYGEINQILSTIKLLVNDPDDKIIRRLDMYMALKMRLMEEEETMLRNLEMRFNSLVQMKEKSFPKARSVTMSISKQTSKIIECVSALLDADYDFVDVNDFFMKNIFEPIVCRAVSLEVTSHEKEHVMSLSYNTGPVTDELRPSYQIVFVNLRTVLFYLINMNVELPEGGHFLPRIFQDRQKDFMELIFNECLVHCIPKTFEEKNQCTMKADISKMSNLLIEMNFFEPPIEDGDDLKLSDYALKIDELFLQQFTKSILASSSELLKRDLHDMMLISEEIISSVPLPLQNLMVSKSTVDFIKLLEKVLKLAISSTEDHEKTSNLMAAIRSSLENYPFTIQLHHSKFLSKIPQQSALFYNNCMFLYFWIKNNRDIEHYNIDGVAKTLKDQATEILECQVAKQKIQLLEILGEFGNFFIYICTDILRNCGN